MATLSVTFDRSSFELPDLVIGQYPTDESPWWLPEDGLEEPDWQFRMTLAPDSAYSAGNLPLAAVLDASSVPLVIYAKSAPGVTLAQARAVIEAACAQFIYDLTITVDGTPRTYTALPSWPSWGAVDSGMASAGIARAQITVPVNPPSAP